MQDNLTKIAVKITPNAGRNEIVGLQNEVWRIRIAAPPDKGKANNELIDFLSDVVKARKVDIIIIKGHTSHNKLISITGLTREEVNQRLAGWKH
ncbi:MAG: YggU family protein [Dehalococcoidales bacterium]|nr:YggU family protein [Dehalococcoidales bacterium]